MSPKVFPLLLEQDPHFLLRLTRPCMILLASSHTGRLLVLWTPIFFLATRLSCSLSPLSYVRLISQLQCVPRMTCADHCLQSCAFPSTFLFIILLSLSPSQLSQSTVTCFLGLVYLMSVSISRMEAPLDRLAWQVQLQPWHQVLNEHNRVNGLGVNLLLSPPTLMHMLALQRDSPDAAVPGDFLWRWYSGCWTWCLHISLYAGCARCHLQAWNEPSGILRLSKC